MNYKVGVTLNNKDNVPVGYNSDNKNVFNSLNGIQDSDLANIKFIKDPEKLYYQYHNLIFALGKYYSQEFHMQADRQDLFSYIADAFVSLVIEYDKNSGVDFTGYIDKALRARIKYSYIQREQTKAKRTLIYNDRRTVEDELSDRQLNGKLVQYDRKGNISYVPLNNDTLDQQELYELLDEIGSPVALTNMDILIIACLYEGYTTPRKIHRQLQVQYGKKYDYKEVKDSYEAIKDYLALKYKDELTL